MFQAFFRLPTPGLRLARGSVISCAALGIVHRHCQCPWGRYLFFILLANTGKTGTCRGRRGGSLPIANKSHVESLLWLARIFTWNLDPHAVFPYSTFFQICLPLVPLAALFKLAAEAALVHAFSFSLHPNCIVTLRKLQERVVGLQFCPLAPPLGIQLSSFPRRVRSDTALNPEAGSFLCGLMPEFFNNLPAPTHTHKHTLSLSLSLFRKGSESEG